MSQLILTRRQGERIMIGDDIIITTKYIGRYFVALGITAPPDVPVDREEILLKKIQEIQQKGEGYA